MAGFLSNDEIFIYTGDLMRHFETFSNPVLIYKEAIKNIISIDNVGFEGYHDSANVKNFTYTPITGQFPAIITYSPTYKGVEIGDLNTVLENGEVLIKVQSDARDFLRNGKTEKIQINENTFNMEGFESVKNYLGLKFYFFKLKATQ